MVEPAPQRDGVTMPNMAGNQQPDPQRPPRHPQHADLRPQEPQPQGTARPIRRQYTWRKLSDSTSLQLRGDGVANYPVQIIDNRPFHAQADPGDHTPSNANHQPVPQLRGRRSRGSAGPPHG